MSCFDVHARGLRGSHGAALLSAALWLSGSPVAHAQAIPALSFGAWGQVYGYLNMSYTSPLLGGSVNININGASDYKSWWTGSGQTGSGLAAATYDIQPGQGGQDPLYDLVTSNGQYRLTYQGQAETTRTALHTQISSSIWDHDVGGTGVGTQVDATPNTSMWSTASAGWSQQFYIPADRFHAAGSYGAILMGIKLSGLFPSAGAGLTNSASSSLYASTTFVDSAGVSYASSFGTQASAYDPSWSGSATVFKKLLFQYGTTFSLNFQQYSSTGNNGAADFSHTGVISQIEVPFGATLYTGAGQAGLGSDAELYGQVFNSATADAENTNWDFGNNGGGFTPNVPEPQSWALALAGLTVAGWTARRRRA